MNVIQKAVDDIHFRIPPQVLQEVFIRRNQDWRQSGHASIDEQILACVVRPRVLTDCNLIGGTTRDIPLGGLAQHRPNEYEVVVRVPKDRTGGRTINSVLHVGYTAGALGAQWISPGHTANMGMYAARESTAAVRVTQAALGSMDRAPIVATSACSLVGENVVRIREAGHNLSHGYLHCVLADDDNLSHIQLRSYRDFCKLVEFAVKSYIYNESIVTIDQNQLMVGMSLGAFKNVVDSYSDAEQNYQDYLSEVWEQVALMNDPQGYDAIIELLAGGGPH